MNRRTRLVVGALRRLPRPETPTERYLTGVRRELPRPLARLVLGRVAPHVELTDIEVPVADGVSRRVRLYRDTAPVDAPVPLVVNFHGGGFVFGNLTGADWACGNLAAETGALVASVDYRLAPEHPAPVPYADAWAATTWLAEHAGELGADPERIVIMGESAGGNLAALVALAARDVRRTGASGPRLAGQVLVYPAIDLTLSSPSVDERPDAPMLRRATLDWYGRLYLPQGRPDSIAGDDPRVSPIYAADHRDLPPTLILAAGEDPLRDDALRYAEVLRTAGVPVQQFTYPEAIHGFMSIPLFEPDARAGLTEIVDWLRTL